MSRRKKKDRVTFDEAAPEADNNAVRFVREETMIRDEKVRQAFLRGHARGFKLGWDAAVAAEAAPDARKAEPLARSRDPDCWDAIREALCAPFDPARAQQA